MGQLDATVCPVAPSVQTRQCGDPGDDLRPHVEIQPDYHWRN